MSGAGTAASPYKLGLVTSCADGQLLKYTTANGWTCASDVDTDTNTPNTDNQTLIWNSSTNQLAIAGGNTIDLTSLKDNTDSQAITLSGNVLTLQNGGSVDLSKYVDNTSQTLSFAGDILTLSNGGTVDLSKYTNTDSQRLSIVGNTISLTNGGSIALPTYTDTNKTYAASNGLTLAGTVFGISAPTCNATAHLDWRRIYLWY